MVLIAGYFWVNSFILDEFQNIKRNTVTAGGTSPCSRNPSACQFPSWRGPGLIPPAIGDEGFQPCVRGE